jgi:hypothetical protein
MYVCNVCLYVLTYARRCIQKFSDWPPEARTTNGTALCHQVQLFCYIVSQSSEFCHHSFLCCFPTSVYYCKRTFHYDSVRKHLDTPSYVFISVKYTELKLYTFSPPAPVAARSRTHIDLDPSNTGIVGSNTVLGIDVCPHFSVLYCPV